MGPGPYCSIAMTSSVHNENDIIIRGTQLVVELNRGTIPIDSIASIVYSAGFSDFEGIQETMNISLTLCSDLRFIGFSIPSICLLCLFFSC